MELDLDEVEATDNKVKRFYCCYKECGASFGRKFRLDRHLRSHRNEVNNSMCLVHLLIAYAFFSLAFMLK